MQTLVAVAVRDRPALVERMLASVRVNLPEALVHVALDPAGVLDVPDVTRFGAQVVHAYGRPSLPERESARARVARMRCDAILWAGGGHFDRVLVLDSDVSLSAGFAAELDRLWPHVDRLRCGGLTLGNYRGYSAPPYLIERHESLGASVRTHAMGACFALPVSPRVLDLAAKGVRGSWDTAFSTHAAGGRILTSERSFVRHDGRGSGINATRNPDLDFCELAEDLRR